MLILGVLSPVLRSIRLMGGSDASPEMWIKNDSAGLMEWSHLRTQFCQEGSWSEVSTASLALTVPCRVRREIVTRLLGLSCACASELPGCSSVLLFVVLVVKRCSFVLPEYVRS